MKLFDLVGNGELLGQLMRSARAERIVHALLFVGAAGSGKRTAAKLFVQGLYCTGAEPPCGVCAACKRVAGGTHPDVHILRPEEGHKSILVEQVREIVESIGMMPYEGGMHAVIIEQADALNDAAQNALLKTLEEPVLPTMFFLLSESPANLLPTIRSRCQTVRFRPLTVEECEGVLEHQGVDKARAHRLAGVSGGSVGQALAIHADGSYFDLRKRVLQSLDMLKTSGSVSAAVSLLSKEKERAADVLEIMESLARDAMALENGAEAFGEDARILKFSGRNLLMEIMEIRRRLNANIAWSDALDTAYFRLIQSAHTPE